MLKKIVEIIERFIMTEMVGAVLFVLIPFIITGFIILGFIYMEANFSFDARLVIVWTISTYFGAIHTYKFAKWWFKKKDKKQDNLW